MTRPLPSKMVAPTYAVLSSREEQAARRAAKRVDHRKGIENKVLKVLQPVQ
jgi:hypothetical protein